MAGSHAVQSRTTDRVGNQGIRNEIASRDPCIGAGVAGCRNRARRGSDGRLSSGAPVRSGAATGRSRAPRGVGERAASTRGAAAADQCQRQFFRRTRQQPRVDQHRYRTVADLRGVHDPLDRAQLRQERDAEQTIFDFGKFASLGVAHAQAASGDAQYQAAEQDLILRTATAYFNVLTAEDELRFAQANEQALAKQLDQAQQRFNVGLSAITDVDAAKAQHDAAAAAVIQARNAVFDAREALSQITGKPVGVLDRLTDNLPLNKPVPDSIDAWVDLALRTNPALQAQRDQVTAADRSINVARAGHLPTLNAQVSYSDSPSWGAPPAAGFPASAFDSQRHDTVVGLVVQVPIFSGGFVQSQVRQSIAQRDQQSDILEQDRRNVVRNTRSAFNAIEAGISEVEAQKQAVISAQKALEATQAGFEVGTRTIVDVLISQQNLFQAQSNYSQARHAFVINQLTLKSSAGTLEVKDLQAANALLQ